MFLLSKSECVGPEGICTQHTSMHGQPLEIPKYQSRGLKRKKNSMWGENIFLKKTMSEKSLITKYALRNILPGNAKIQKFCNLDCLASSYI